MKLDDIMTTRNRTFWTEFVAVKFTVCRRLQYKMLKRTKQKNNWLKWHVKPSEVILCLKVRELFIFITFFCVVFFFFLHTIIYEVLRSNTNNSYIICFGLMSRVFAKGLGDQGSIPGWVIPRTRRKKKKKVHDTALLNIQHYKVWIKGKVGQSWERSSTLPYTSM